jgi:uroporphyrin-III C-methyltransferase / precorrin-2 dehydrogenase / sirohydrochlorin ferrochelatase
MSWLHPIFIDLTDQRVIVVGGGAVAERKIETLLAAGAKVTVVSPGTTELVGRWAGTGRLVLKPRAYQAGDLRGFRLAYAATSDPAVNRAVRIESRAEGVWLNAIDQPDLCDFITPAIVRRGNLAIAISTNGRCPGLASRIRQELEHRFGPEYADLVEEMGQERDRRKAGLKARATPDGTRPASAPDSLEPANGPDLRSHAARRGSHAGPPGVVFLVGAGPGDPDLITVKGYRVLEAADTVVYDALVDPRLLDLCPAHTSRIFVGKRDNRHTLPQAEINALLIDEAWAGRRVVRLKGGDPFVFGRGGEEAEALSQSGVRFEVVPGVSAGNAVPAYAGIPLTHRDFTSELVFLTGHECVTNPSPVDWSHYGRSAASLVIFMGLHNLGAIVGALLENGRDPQCPAAVIENGTLKAQRTVAGPLANIADLVAESGIQPPALIVIGGVVGLREKLNWFETAAVEARQT